MIKREDLSKNLLGRCQVCVHGGKDIFPDGIDFDPTKDCPYFGDVNDITKCADDYDCGYYLHNDDFEDIYIKIKQ